MSLVDVRYNSINQYFSDMRAFSLESLALMPIQDSIEMGLSLPQLETKLKGLAYYPVLFKKAFGDPAITSDRVSFALSQFLKSIVSYQSKYDEGRANFPPGLVPPDPFPNFTAQENRGKAIFFGQTTLCAFCHETESFNFGTAKSNGLDLVTTDRGFGATMNNTIHDAKFRAASLRNIELTAPYMHDGRFNTLEEVVEHYSTGVMNHPNLFLALTTPSGGLHLNLSDDDKAALVAFLKTLTDRSMTTDVKYSNPFK